MSNGVRACSKQSCDRPVRYNGYCEPHGHQEWRERERGTRECEKCGETFAITATKLRFCSRSCASRYAHTLPGRKTRKSAMSHAIDSGDGVAITREARSRSQVTADGCWIWPGRNTSGYPIVSHGRTSKLVHRLVLSAKLGADLGKLEAHHICGVAACVNPEHLTTATKRENIAEMLARRNLNERIASLEAALREVAPNHELLKLA